jgi:hypothetical protein
MSIMVRFANWLLRNQPDEYIRGWQDGVEQERMEPETTEHHITGEHYDGF